MLRIDVDRAQPYAVPADNPFVVRGRGACPRSGPTACATPGASPSTARPATSTSATWARTLSRRSTPSRRRDEAGRTTAGTSRKGAAASSPPPAARGTGSRSPWSSTPTAEGCSVTGGVVYRGCRMPGYAGTYFYGDFCSGFVSSFRLQGGRAVDQRDWTSQLGRRSNLSSFGVDADGEVYVVDSRGSSTRSSPRADQGAASAARWRTSVCHRHSR